MSDDVIRNIKIIATGEHIDSTTASVKGLGDATDKLSSSNDNQTKTAASAKLSLTDYAAGLYLAKSAYDAVTTGADNAATAMAKLRQEHLALNTTNA